MSLDRVYVRFKGKTLGPLPPQKIRDLVSRGQITRLHELSGDGLTWKRAEEFGELFNPAPPSATASSATRSEGDLVATASTKGVLQSNTLDSSESNPPSRPRQGEAPEASVQWYAHLDGETLGPLTSSQLIQRIESKEVRQDTLVWRAGYDTWRPAADSFPEQFGRTPAVLNDEPARNGNWTGSSGVDDASELTHHLAKQRGWTLFIGISTLVFAGLFALYFVTVMIVGAERSWAPFQGSFMVIYGLLGLTLCGVFTAGAILMLRYAVSLKNRTLFGNPRMKIVAIQRLGSFWSYAGMVLLTIEIVLIGGAILLLIIGFAASEAIS